MSERLLAWGSRKFDDFVLGYVARENLNRFGIKLFGYGALSQFELNSETKTFMLYSRRSVFLANWWHAHDELDAIGHETFSLKSLHVWILRTISIGLQRRQSFPGLLNGSSFRIEFSSDEFLHPPALVSTLAMKELWVSRSIGKLGFLIPNYEPSLEWIIRSNTFRPRFFFSHGYLFPIVKNRIFSKLLRIRFKSLMQNIAKRRNRDQAQKFCSVMPKWHYSRSFFTLLFDEDIFGAQNIYRKLTSHKVEDQRFLCRLLEEDQNYSIFELQNGKLAGGQFATVNGYIFPTDLLLKTEHSFTKLWPSRGWSRESSRFAAVPNSNNHKVYKQLTSLHTSSSFAHFLENRLPATLFLKKYAGSGQVILSNTIDTVMERMLMTTWNADFIVADPHTSYSINLLMFATHKDFRPLLIQGSEKIDEMVNINSMSHIISTLVDSHNVVDPSGKYRRLYIQREDGLLRRLSNKSQVERLLESHNFITVQTKHLSLEERIEILGAAKIVVAESGAASANFYLMKKNARTIEIRHPLLVNSNEHRVIAQFAELNWCVLPGKRASFLARLLYGTDSYTVSLDALAQALEASLENSE